MDQPTTKSKEAETFYTIAIADPSAYYLRNITMVIQREGYRAIPVKSGKALLALLETELPDLIMVDSDLPDMPGLTVCKELRTTEATSKIPLIITTSSGDAYNGSVAVENSVCFLPKPVDTKTLSQAITKLLFPLPKTGHNLTIRNLQKTVQWQASVVSAKNNYLVISRDKQSTERQDDFRTGRDCLIEYMMADFSLIEYTATIPNMSEETLDVRLETPIRRTQQRQFFRRTIALTCRYRLPGDFFRLTKTIDISGGGAKLADVPDTLGMDDEFEFDLHLPDQTFHFKAKVQWQRPLPNQKQEVGVLFTNIMPSQQEELVMFLFSGHL